ncbi:MAG TPA: hypothetical protein VFE46_06145 [Pirellulales bacterium]|jgi:hypothetical protein|nr:hypothetical protein [Pirellulales bacterium]
MNEPIKIQCPTCGAQMLAGINLAGHIVRCLKCSHDVQIPNVNCESHISINTGPDRNEELLTFSRRHDRPATEKQKIFADELGIEYSTDISCRELSHKIDSALDRYYGDANKEIDASLKTLPRYGRKAKWMGV